MTKEEAVKVIESIKQEIGYIDFFDAFNMAFAALREQVERDKPNPMTLDELKQHLSKGHPHEIEPLYIVFNPPMPVDDTPRWRDAYNLSSLVAHDAENYGKRWKVYRRKPKEENK